MQPCIVLYHDVIDLRRSEIRFSVYRLFGILILSRNAKRTKTSTKINFIHAATKTSGIKVTTCYLYNNIEIKPLIRKKKDYFNKMEKVRETELQN